MTIMKNKLIITLAITLFAAAAFAAPAKMQVALSINPSTTLPGLSVPLNLNVRNGAKALHLGSSLRMLATSPDGQSYFLDWGGIDNGELELPSTDDEDGFILSLTGSGDPA